MNDRFFRSMPWIVLALFGLAAASWMSDVHQRRASVSSAQPPSLPAAPPADSSPMELTHTDRAAIRSVIEQQLRAFQQNDAELAFSFASPAIQAQFQDPEQFMAMVESAYRPVYRPRSVMFESIVRIEGKVAQQVVVMGPDGGLFNAFYLMQRQANESWRIHGCVLTPIQGEST